MGKQDTRLRATFENIAAHQAVRPTNRELRWLVHIERHGPQASTALIDLTSDTHRCKDTALRALQRLRAAGLLTLPPGQRAIERAEFHPYIYDMTAKARAHMDEAELLEPAVRPTGHFWHAYTVSALTAAIDRTATRAGLKYVPAQTILDLKNTNLAIPTNNGSVVPDQIFALNYGGSFRAFLLEVDRSTEPQTSRAARESLSRKLSAYGAIFARDLARQHYGLKSPLALLFTFSSRLRAAWLLEAIRENWPNLAPVTLVQVVDKTDPLLIQANSYISSPWQRATGDNFDLFRP
jgi:hypothetical protein